MLLLALYEFEAKAQLGDSDLCFCLDAAEALLNADPGTFESFAGTIFKVQNVEISIFHKYRFSSLFHFNFMNYLPFL